MTETQEDTYELGPNETFVPNRFKGWIVREIVGEELAMYERHEKEKEEFEKRRTMSQR
jgi:hypothetical protein